jgi:4-amino-4-deoxy-L-arabinose transferase-like glycosyltransferase
MNVPGGNGEPAGSMGIARLIEAVERRPLAAFATFLVVHGLVWTALPSLLYFNLPLDVIEAMTYGREWQLGYDKLPPLPWFLAEIVYRLFGDDALYACCQVLVLIAFAAVWKTARPLVGATGALAAVLIIDGMHYFNASATKLNHNVIELPLWALAGFAFHAGLRRNRLGHWILLGVAIGLAWWAKYFIVVLVAPLALFLIFDRDARRRLAGPGPWIAAALALAIAAPHLVWLMQNDFLPFHYYITAKARVAHSLAEYLLNPVEYVGGQAFFLVPALLIAAPLFWRPSKEAGARITDAFDRRLITLLTFGPALALLALSFLTGRRTNAMWGFPLWLFLGLWIVMVAPAALDRMRLAFIGLVWAAVFAIFVAAFVADYLVLPNFDHRYRAAFFPGDLLSAAITQRFETATGREPAYIIGSMWDAGNVAHYSAEHPQPRVLIDGLPGRAPWIDLSDLRAHGAALVWTDGDPHTLPETFTAVAPGAAVGAPFDLPYHRGEGVAHVGWAILPPQTR